jgi:hypothetical protein
LDLALQAWQLFLTAFQLGLSIDDENQKTLSAVFPELASMQTVLDHLARLPRAGEPGPAPGQPFPAQEFVDLIQHVHSLVGRQARALAAIGVNSPVFAPGAAPPGELLPAALDGATDFTCSPPAVRLNTKGLTVVPRLRGAVQELMRLLETAPAAALNLPKYLAPTPPSGGIEPPTQEATTPAAPRQSRLQVGTRSGVITLDGQPYPATPAQAVFFEALVQVRGHWRSGPYLRQHCDELEGARVDRVCKSLPSPLRELIEVEKGKGYRLVDGVVE